MKSFVQTLFTVSSLYLAATSARADSLLILGDNSRGQKTIPIDPASVLQISCGREHLVALRRDGSVSAWGYDGNGRATPPEIKHAISVAAGSYHSLALLSDGTVAAWGFNGEGLTKVPTAVSNVIQIAAGGFHSLALRADGSIVGWGYNGQNRATPPVGLSGVVSIAAGRDHSVALKRNGSVVCWGLNDSKQAETPANLDQVIAVAAGDFHTLALKRDGTVAAWGNNQDGQCSVPAGLTQVVAIAAGHRHGVALKADGTVVAWGDNSASEVTIPSGTASVVTVAAGGLNTALIQAQSALITSQPQSKNVLAGRDAEFSVSATGSGSLRFQWYFDGTAISDSTRIHGATAGTLTFSNIERSDAGVLSVDIYDGNTLLRSANALLVVRSLVELNQLVLSGGTARISFGDAEGELLSLDDAGLYQMQWSSDLSQWSNLPGPLVAESGDLVGIDPNAGTTTTPRFYRLVATK